MDDIKGPRKDNCLITIPDTRHKPGTHVVGRNALCMREKPCPIGAKMVLGPIRIWEDDPGMRGNNIVDASRHSA